MNRINRKTGMKKTGIKKTDIKMTEFRKKGIGKTDNRKTEMTKTGQRKKKYRGSVSQTVGEREIRLNKYLASCGVCSRREADRLIEQGRVSVNDRIASMGQTVTDADEICVDGKVLDGKARSVVLAYYKPIGVICTEKDSHADKKITDMIDYPVRVTYAGRLDKDSEGLILLTNDGDLIHSMMRGANRHEKEYIVKVDREITPAFLTKMAEGVWLKELDITTRPCEISQIGKFTFQIILTQGVNRQIRRMCRTLGFQVKSLKRIRVMNIKLDGLQYGTYREITGSELEQLYREAGMQYAGTQHTDI